MTDHDPPQPATPPRQISGNDALVLDVLRSEGLPLTAYEIMERLRPDRPKVAPPTIYRALSHLLEAGLVHRIETLNAYMECRCPDHGPATIFAICDDCGDVDERAAPEALAAITGALGTSGFQPSRPVIEVHGLCNQCDGKAAS